MSFAPQTSISLTAPGAFAGKLVTNSDQDIDSFVSEEASAEIAFGLMVAQGTADKGALLPATSAAAMIHAFVGVVVHADNYAKSQELGSTGLKPKTVFGVLRKGRIYVPVEEAVTPASAVRVRVLAGSGTVGAFRTTADSTNCVDISKFARFRSTTSGAGVAELDIDMTQSFSGVADT